MSDLSRVRLENGAEKNVGAEFARTRELTVLEEPTHFGDGTPRATTRNGGRRKKQKTSVAKSAAAKKASNQEPAAMAEEATE